MVTIDDFTKLDLRIIRVLEAERIERSEKLLKLIVDDGETHQRQILSGIGKSYDPKELVGNNLVAILNLSPREIMGQLSNGMILAVGDNLDKISLIVPERNVEQGSKIR